MSCINIYMKGTVSHTCHTRLAWVAEVFSAKKREIMKGFIEQKAVILT